MSINIFCNVLLEREPRFVNERCVELTNEAQMYRLKIVSRDVDLVLGITEDESKFMCIFNEPLVFVGLGKFDAGMTGQIEIERKTRLVVSRSGVRGLGHCHALCIICGERSLALGYVLFLKVGFSQNGVSLIAEPFSVLFVI